MIRGVEDLDNFFGGASMAQRVRWRLGDNEIEAEGTDRFIQKQLESFLKKVGVGFATRVRADLPAQIVAASTDATASRKAPSPAEYFREKKPRGGTERLLVLGKYLQDHRGKDTFIRSDVSKLCIEAKVNDVHGQYFTLAVKQGLLRTVGKGSYSLTISGEDAVNGMPTKKGS